MSNETTSATSDVERWLKEEITIGKLFELHHKYDVAGVLANKVREGAELIVEGMEIVDRLQRELAAAKENSNGLMKLYNKTKEELEKYQQFDGNQGIKCMVEVAKERDTLKARVHAICQERDQLRAEVEQVKAQRNKVGMEVRAEYLPKLTAFKEQLALAEKCVDDLRRMTTNPYGHPAGTESLAAYDKFKAGSSPAPTVSG